MKYLYLALPCIAAIAVPLYNVTQPHLFGIPFFYWSLLALVPVSSGFIYLASRGEKL